MLLSKILIHLCTTIHYIVEENIFVVIVDEFLVQKTCQHVMLKIALKSMVKKLLRRQKKMDMLNSKAMKEK